MAGPWEDYQPTAQSAPWDDYKTSKPTKSADYAAGREAPGALRGALSVLNGPTFGFGDELAGAVGGAYDALTKGGKLSDRYKENRDYARGAQDYEKEANPWATGLTQAAAGLPLGMAKLFGSGSKGLQMGILGQTGRAAGTGAIYGGLGGAGNSTADSLTGVAMDTGIGAAAGAALSGAALPLGRVIGGGAMNVAQRYSDRAAGNYAQQKVAEAIIRDGVEAAPGANHIGAVQSELAKLGDSAVIADSGGKSLRRLLDTQATLPGRTANAAEDFIRNRQSGTAARMISAADDALGTNGARLSGTLDDLITQRSNDAAPLYRQMHSQTIAQPSSALQQLVMAADDLGATKLGRQMSTARQVPYTLDYANPQNWALRDLDHVKQGLDTLIAKQWDTANGKITPLGNAYLELKNKLIGELDGATVNPQTGQSLYKSARDAFAGPSALIEAAKAGQSSISKNESSIVQVTSAMSTSERDAFRVGALEALREKLGRSSGGRTEVMNMWQNPATRDKLKAIFGNDTSFAKFESIVANESKMKMLESVGRGSQTAERMFAAGDLDAAAISDAGALAGSVATASPVGILASGANFWNKVKTPEPVRNEIGRILMSGGLNGQNELQSIAQITQQMNQDRARQAGTFGLIGSQVGNIGRGLLGN